MLEAKKLMWSFDPEWDMPKQGDLLQLVKPYYYDDNEVLIGNRNFLSYNKTSVPFVYIKGEVYYRDMSEAVPDSLVGDISSCRMYIRTEIKVDLDYAYKF